MIRIHLLCSGMLIFISILTTCDAFTQSRESKYEFGLGAGLLVYQGDLAPSTLGSYKTSRFGVNLFVGRYLSSSLMVRANLLWGRLAGDDSKYDNPAYRQQRNFKFTSTVKELSGQLVWTVLKKKSIEPYLLGGVGLSNLKIDRDWSKFNKEYFATEAPAMAAALAVDSAHSLPGTTPVGILGFGTRIFIKENWSLFAEYSYRFMSTDYLDGFSVSANPERNDHYMNYSVGVSHRLKRKNRPNDCPVIRF